MSVVAAPKLEGNYSENKSINVEYFVLAAPDLDCSFSYLMSRFFKITS